jgi:hypothetical protein
VDGLDALFGRELVVEEAKVLFFRSLRRDDDDVPNAPAPVASARSSNAR